MGNSHLSSSELEILLDLIAEEPHTDHADRLIETLRAGSELEPLHERQLVFAVENASAKLRPELLEALTLHAVRAGKWELVTAARPCGEQQNIAVLSGLDHFAWKKDPGEQVWTWLDTLTSTNPSWRRRVWSVIAEGLPRGWKLGDRTAWFLESLKNEPEGRGMARSDLGREAARVLLAGLQSKANRECILAGLEETLASKNKTAQANAVWCLAADAGLRNSWADVERFLPNKPQMFAAVDGMSTAVHEHVRQTRKPKLATGAIPWLVKALQTGNQATQKEALHVLWNLSYWGKLSVAAALPEIERAMEVDKLRAAAIRTIAAMAYVEGPAVAYLRSEVEKHAGDKNGAVRKAVREALFELPSNSGS